jgi:hypothetical protein
MSNANPALPPVTSRFKPQWQSGKTKQVSIPVAIVDDVLAIARCLDRDPTIAAQVVEFAQSLVEQQKAPHTATNS